MATTTQADALSPVTTTTETTKPPLKVLGFNVSGLELTMFYMSINIILFIIILILSCRSGAKKAQEKKREVELAVRNKEHIAVENKENDIELEIARDLEEESEVNTCKICCGAFVADIMGRSFIYSAFLVHVWDQGSDLGVIYTWFTADEGKWRYLGWISIGILINYRLFSAYSLRKAQRGWRDTFLQVLDLQLFVDVFRSFVEVKPTDSLYWIRAMEAVLESCLQILLQFVYLYQATDVLVWLSLFGSMASVIFSLLHYTDVVFKFEDSPIKGNIAWISRFLFRLCEVTSRCMVLALIWSTWNSEDQQSLYGAYIVACIIIIEFAFYIFLTQWRIPPWEIAAFLVVNIDLTLTFEGRAGALTKPLRHNPFYVCMCKPVAEMFTHVSHETEEFFNELHHTSHSNHSKKKKERQKLLIAPAHYVYRFLESVFELFCVLTYAVIDNTIWVRLFENNTWTVALATLTTILTPILYCTVRAFADESKTLERNLIAMVHHGGETNEIIQLIQAGASLKQTDYEGNSIVHACVSKNNSELLKVLIEKYERRSSKVFLDVTNKKGYTPALLACQHGSVDCLKLLSNVEQLDFNQVHVHLGQSMVHICSEYDQANTIAYLATLGNDKCNLHHIYSHITPHGLEIGGYNAVHVAARHNSINALDVLLHNKINFRARLSNGDTAAIVAASRGHTIILQKLFDSGDFFDIQGNFGHTPLYRAALNNHPGTVAVLGRDFGADANIRDENSTHIVVQAFKSCGFGVLEALAELGCRFNDTGCNKYIEVYNEDKLTALMWAAKYDYPKLLKTLLDSGADKNQTNKWDETAAHHAAAMGNLDCLKILYQFGANVNSMNEAKQTPKDKAIQQNMRNCVDWFNEIQ